MPKINPNVSQSQKVNKKVNKSKEETSLKGTLIAVFAVGAIIVFFWVSIFQLYLSRM
ncbi:cytochrome c oxidase subunit 2A [Bacillus taeanensis]|uniref:Cytochrome c oxidase subunit 2A n=1 Tax=Bacillus taeanensis TaxID=273032 RepID=A0A366XR33_9BACI|nr:cytochrome c oxidase subunit 2A [Bacillus taeanensis]RBW68166.1 cytochrome c oxidase subunit 2A [Bacillus taeanensis]